MKTMAQRYFDYGIRAELAHNYDEAILFYSEAIQNDSNFAQAYYNRGNVYRRYGQSYKSLRDHEIAVLLDPALKQIFKAA